MLNLLTTYYLSVLLPHKLFKKNGYDVNVCSNVRDFLYNTDVITSVVRFSVHSPVGKLI